MATHLSSHLQLAPCVLPAAHLDPGVVPPYQRCPAAAFGAGGDTVEEELAAAGADHLKRPVLAVQRGCARLGTIALTITAVAQIDRPAYRAKAERGFMLQRRKRDPHGVLDGDQWVARDQVGEGGYRAALVVISSDLGRLPAFDGLAVGPVLAHPDAVTPPSTFDTDVALVALGGFGAFGVPDIVFGAPPRSPHAPCHGQARKGSGASRTGPLRRIRRAQLFASLTPLDAHGSNFGLSGLILEFGSALVGRRPFPAWPACEPNNYRTSRDIR